MGFHQRFITKESIIDNISEIDEYLEPSSMIFDNWSSNFQSEINPDERPLRESIKRKMEFSGGKAYQHYGYEKLTSLSECLISLMTEPSWLDVQFVKDKLGFELTLEEQGRFDILVKKSIDAIINYFDQYES